MRSASRFRSVVLSTNASETPLMGRVRFYQRRAAVGSMRTVLKRDTASCRTSKASGVSIASCIPGGITASCRRCSVTACPANWPPYPDGCAGWRCTPLPAPPPHAGQERGKHQNDQKTEINNPPRIATLMQPLQKVCLTTKVSRCTHTP